MKNVGDDGGDCKGESGWDLRLELQESGWGWKDLGLELQDDGWDEDGWGEDGWGEGGGDSSSSLIL